MRTLLSIVCLLISASASALDASTAPPPPTYALVVAMGDSFSVVTQEESVGSKLLPMSRRQVDAGDVLNRLVLQALDREVATVSPESQRIYLSMAASRLPSASPSRRAQVYFDAALSELRKNSQHFKWDKLFIVTPAFRKVAKDGMGAELQGAGLFIDPLCESKPLICSMGNVPVSGPTALLPDGTIGTVNSYIAPFLFITVWEVNASSLTVINKLEVFDYKRMVGEDYRQSVVFNTADSGLIAQQMMNLVGKSIGSALRQTTIAGRVEARLLETPISGEQQ